MSKTHEGYLLIADITVYIRYLTESELEHAQETLAALLDLLVQNTRSPLVISRLAGDAVISYGLREDFFRGQKLQGSRYDRRPHRVFKNHPAARLLKK